MVEDKPSRVMVLRAFASRVAAVLAERDFAPTNDWRRFSRARGTAVDRVELTPEPYPRPGDVRCSVLFEIEDEAIRAIAPTWELRELLSSFGTLEPFPTANLAVAAEADWLLYEVESALEFFDLAAHPEDLLAEASRRYVPGFVDPSRVAPLLRVYLGPEGVARYASGLLRGRPELWPAFLAHRGQTTLPKTLASADHGTELALMVATHAPTAKLAMPPADTVRSPDLAAANLRAVLGLKLRAWGEPVAAGLLRRVSDDRIEALWDKLRDQGIDRVDDARGARAVLHAATGEDRPCLRASPEPLYYQYKRLHGPFGE
jgi:hypothetical protein